MLKQEERKILEQIKMMIADTFYLQGVIGPVIPNAERSIDDDAVYDAVEALDTERSRNLKKDAEHAEIVRKLEHENNVLAEKLKTAESSLADYKGICQRQSGKISEMQEGLEAMNDSVTGLQEIIDKLEAENMRLKAEIYDLRRELNK